MLEEEVESSLKDCAIVAELVDNSEELTAVLEQAGTKLGPDQLGPDRTGSTRTSPGRIRSDQLGSTRIDKK